jgi:signal transduction histidine kinase
MQRLTNLDRAEILPVNMNELIRDVATFVTHSEDTPPEIELNLNPIPTIQARPQFISAVMSTLMTGGVRDHGKPTKITVTTTETGGNVQITVDDPSAEVPEAAMAESLDPTFQVSGNRVQSCNWNLFNARQVIHQHNGEITVASAPGQGTRITITLPALPNTSAPTSQSRTSQPRTPKP